MTTKPKTAKAQVRAAYPSAECEYWQTFKDYAVHAQIDLPKSHKFTLLGNGRTKGAAWSDACANLKREGR